MLVTMSKQAQDEDLHKTLSRSGRVFMGSVNDFAGEPGPKNQDAEGRAVEAASLAYFRNRASAPRDLSANACQQLRNACLAVLQDAY